VAGAFRSRRNRRLAILNQQGGTDTLGNANGLPIIQTPIAGAFSAVFSSAAGKGFPFAAALSVLSQRGYARTLSEPTLVALSGQPATFLAGGEFPVPMPAALGTVGVDYKKFGVQLQFVPTVVGSQIQLKLASTVSDIDFSLGVSVGGVSVPGVTSRHSETTVRLRDGESFAIAGLLSDRVRSSVDKVPGLGDLPILGTLFRSTSYRREETELLVVVTAHLVSPQGDKPVMPGEDMLADPSDVELFFLGSIESKEASIMVDALVSLAHKLNLTVCAEGVENRPTLEELGRFGADYAQGYFISHPVAPAEIPQIIAHWDKQQREPVQKLRSSTQPR
jgi:Flp pilus assembly secretin CpaC